MTRPINGLPNPSLNFRVQQLAPSPREREIILKLFLSLKRRTLSYLTSGMTPSGSNPHHLKAVPSNLYQDSVDTSHLGTCSLLPLLHICLAKGLLNLATHLLQTGLLILHVIQSVDSLRNQLLIGLTMRITSQPPSRPLLQPQS